MRGGAGVRLSLTRPAQWQLKPLVHTLAPTDSNDIPHGDPAKPNGGYTIAVGRWKGVVFAVLVSEDGYRAYVFDMNSIGVLDQLNNNHALCRKKWSLKEQRASESWTHWLCQQDVPVLPSGDALARVIEKAYTIPGWMRLVGPEAAPLCAAPVQAAVLPALKASAVPRRGPVAKQMPRSGSVLIKASAGKKKAQNLQVSWADRVQLVLPPTQGRTLSTEQERTDAGGDAQ